MNILELQPLETLFVLYHEFRDEVELVEGLTLERELSDIVIPVAVVTEALVLEPCLFSQGKPRQNEVLYLHITQALRFYIFKTFSLHLAVALHIYGFNPDVVCGVTLEDLPVHLCQLVI